MGAANLSLVLLQLASSESIYDFLQAAGLDVCRHIIWQVPGCMRLLPFAVGKHECLVILGCAHQVQSGLMLLLCLSTKACDDSVLLAIDYYS